MNIFEAKSKIFSLSDQMMFNIFAVSVFLPYIVSITVDIIMVVFLFTKSSTWKAIMSYKASKYVLFYIPFAVIVPALYRNYLGIVIGFSAVLIFLLMQYFRKAATRQILENTFDTICIAAVTSVIIGTVEFILMRFGVVHGRFMLRCSSVFFNPNFFGSVMAMVIVLCVYKIISTRGFNIFYFVTMILCVVGIELSSSMFAIVETATGVFFLLYFSRRYKILFLYITVLLFGIASVMLVPELIPRFKEIETTFNMRISIWKIVVEIIKDHPLFGCGGFAYRHFHEQYAYVIGGDTPWKASYAHNILLETVSGNGIIGTLTIVMYFVSMIRDFTRLHPRGKSRNFASLPIALLCGVIAHGFVDVTIMWPQVAILFMIIFAALGALEKIPAVELTHILDFS